MYFRLVFFFLLLLFPFLFIVLFRRIHILVVQDSAWKACKCNWFKYSIHTHNYDNEILIDMQCTPCTHFGIQFLSSKWAYDRVLSCIFYGFLYVFVFQSFVFCWKMCVCVCHSGYFQFEAWTIIPRQIPFMHRLKSHCLFLLLLLSVIIILWIFPYFSLIFFYVIIHKM